MHIINSFKLNIKICEEYCKICVRIFTRYKIWLNGLWFHKRLRRKLVVYKHKGIYHIKIVRSRSIQINNRRLQTNSKSWLWYLTIIRLKEKTIIIYKMQKMQILLQSNRIAFNDSQINLNDDITMWPKFNQNGKTISMVG